MMGNSKIKISSSEELSQKTHYKFKRVHFQLELENGQWESQSREVLDRGNGVTILLYNPIKKSVILTRQFRIPTYLNGNSTGLMIEACAGVIENESPELSIIRETEEETGYKVAKPQKIFEAYMSPAAVTEIIYFYVAEYTDSTKISKGGGLDEECEHIEVLEMKMIEAIRLMEIGEIKDAKTMMLLQYAQLKNLCLL
jgi:GDP-mannose pyrophosphatase NudK